MGIPITRIPRAGIPKAGKTHTGTLPETEIPKPSQGLRRQNSEGRDSEARVSEARVSEAGPFHSDTFTLTLKLASYQLGVPLGGGVCHFMCFCRILPQNPSPKKAKVVLCPFHRSHRHGNP